LDAFEHEADSRSIRRHASASLQPGLTHSHEHPGDISAEYMLRGKNGVAGIWSGQCLVCTLPESKAPLSRR
jgi:hypothetical protein